MRDYRDAKLMAKNLRETLAFRNITITYSQALEIVACQFGFDEWNVLSAKIDTAIPLASEKISIQPPIPILRIFDVEKALEFYRDFLGFKLDWEHRFGENFPLYCQMSRSGMLIHLSEHAGDASPGARLFVPLRGVKSYHAELSLRDYRYMKPGLEQADWGLEMTVTDPFSNRITFCEREIKSE